MGFLDLFRRKDTGALEYAKAIGIHQNNINQGQEQLEMQQILGVKDAIIKDKGAETIYDSEIFNSVVVEENGELKVMPQSPNYQGQASRLFLSSKLGLGNIDKREAKFEIMLGEREFINMEMNSKEYDYHLGIGSRYVAQQIHMRQSIIGSIEGKTMRNLLITPHVTRVEAGEIPKKRTGGSLF